MTESEIRVRPVTRFVVTSYTPPEPLPPGVHTDAEGARGKLETLGEFANEGHAERVAAAFRASRFPIIGDLITVNAPDLTTEAVVEAVHEWPGRRLLDVYFVNGTYYHGYGGGQVVDTGAPYMLEPRPELPA